MRRASIFVALIFLATASSRADLGGGWRTARPIVLPRGAAGPVYLPLDAEALAGVESLAEYRVVRAGGAEIPYRMVEERGQTESYPLDAKVVVHSAPGAALEEMVLDLGERPASRLRLTLDLIGSDFRCRAQVEGRRDGRRWQAVIEQGRLVRQPGGVEQRDLALPFGDDRFLRLRLFPEQGRLPRIERARVSSEVTIVRQVLAVAAALHRKEDAKERRTVLTLDPGVPARDLAEAQFEIEEPAFDRSVAVEALQQGADWETISTDTLKRLAAGGAVTLPLDILRARKMRFTISNGDDAPLTIHSVKLWRLRRGLVFFAEAGQTYELWYGRPNAPAPAYELERLPLTVPPVELQQASLGAERSLPIPPPAPKPPPPWTERHPWLFWSGLAAVVALLLLLTIRSMRGPGPRPADSGVGGA